MSMTRHSLFAMSNNKQLALTLSQTIYILAGVREAAASGRRTQRNIERRK